MAAENYLFEFSGAQFNITLDLADGAPTTTYAPNVRVIEGTWKTWHLEIDPDVPGIAGLRLLRSTTGSNLTPAQSAAKGYLMMVAGDGRLYNVPSGMSVVARLMTPSEWQGQLATWEASL